MTKKLEEYEVHLNSPILAAINTTITERVIPELQVSLGALENGLNARSDVQYVRLRTNPEDILTIKPLPNGPKWMETKVILLIILESSIHSQTSERLRKPLSLTEWDDGKT